MLDHGITGELEDLQRLTRRFVQDELIPHERVVEENDHFPVELRQSLRKKAVELGLFAYNMPQDAGGPGLPALAQVVIREQLGHVSVPLADVVARVPHALLACNDDQRERFLEPAMRGEKSWAFALTEPQAGSDAGALKTTARAAEGGFLVNGTKHFITNGADADFIILIARYDDRSERPPLVALLVEKGSRGFRTGRLSRKMSWHGYPFAELVFEDAFVPQANLLGDIGQGLRLAMSNINEARIGVAAHCVGMAQRAFDYSLAHAQQRVQFGQAIATYQGIQWMLAEMALALEQARALVYAAARTMDGPGNARAAVSMTKLGATEMLAMVADRAVQIMGGAGIVAESPVEMIYRDARAFRIGEGTSEIQKNQIARNLLTNGASRK